MLYRLYKCFYLYVRISVVLLMLTKNETLYEGGEYVKKTIYKLVGWNMTLLKKFQNL